MLGGQQDSGLTAEITLKSGVETVNLVHCSFVTMYIF